MENKDVILSYDEYKELVHTVYELRWALKNRCSHSISNEMRKPLMEYVDKISKLIGLEYNI